MLSQNTILHGVYKLYFFEFKLFEACVAGRQQDVGTLSHVAASMGARKNKINKLKEYPMLYQCVDSTCLRSLNLHMVLYSAGNPRKPKEELKNASTTILSVEKTSRSELLTLVSVEHI